MARKKTKADEQYNIRRRAKREVNRLERIIANPKTTPLQRKSAQAAIQDLQETIGTTYSKVTGDAERKQAFQDLKNMLGTTKPAQRRTAKKATTESRNRAFERQINLALNGQPSALDRNGDRGQKLAIAFMNAFAESRRGHRRSQHYQMILNAAGTDDLEEAFHKFTRQNRDKIRKMYAAYNNYMADGRMKDTSLMGDDYGDAKYKGTEPYIAEMSFDPNLA